MLRLHPTVLPASHSFPPPLGQLTGGTSTPARDLSGAQDAGSLPADALSGMSPAKHKQEADLHCLFQPVLANHGTGKPKGSCTLTSCLQFPAMELPAVTHSQASQSLCPQESPTQAPPQVSLPYQGPLEQSDGLKGKPRVGSHMQWRTVTWVLRHTQEHQDGPSDAPSYSPCARLLGELVAPGDESQPAEHYNQPRVWTAALSVAHCHPAVSRLGLKTIKTKKIQRCCVERAVLWGFYGALDCQPWLVSLRFLSALIILFPINFTAPA